MRFPIRSLTRLVLAVALLALPGQALAAMRLNIPVVFVSGGPMEAGKVKLLNPTTQKMEFKKLDLIDAMVMAADDKVSDADVAEVERSACPTCGSCLLYTSRCV